MCGISGIFNYQTREPVERERVARLCDAMAQRGPDARGTFFRDQHGVGLGHVRLSIIDLAGGDQPIANEDGTIWTIFNGEIYNYQELRERLTAKGHVFKTRTDTEVLVHLYEEKGERLVDDLLGDFAFAIWDDRDGSLLIARDRLGVKPLFYADYDGQLAFGSTLPTLLAGSRAPREYDPAALLSYLSFGMIQGPLSIYQHMRKLLPGHLLTVRGGRVTIRPYWEYQLRPDESSSEQQFVEELYALLNDAVKRQLMADVPLGAFLSGGVDSSAVVKLMTKHSTGVVKTFSIRFPESKYDESRFFRLLAQELGVEHHEYLFEPHLLQDVDHVVRMFGEPCAIASAFPLYSLSQLARQHVKVVLTGDGPDEIFAGYDLRYRYFEQMVKAQGLLPRPLIRMCSGVLNWPWPLRTTSRAGNTLRRARKFFETISLPREEWFPYLAAKGLTLESSPQALLRPLFAGAGGAAVGRAAPTAGLLPYVADFRRSAGGNGDWMRPFLYTDVKSLLPDEMFVKGDCMTMANGVEARVPLCDHRIVELAARMPSRMKYTRDGVGKAVLRKAMGDHLPKAIMQRPKMGFTVPLDEWFRGELYPLARDYLTDATFRQAGVFDPRIAERLIEDHRAARGNYGYPIWSLVAFEIWRRSIGRT